MKRDVLMIWQSIIMILFFDVSKNILQLFRGVFFQFLFSRNYESVSQFELRPKLSHKEMMPSLVMRMVNETVILKQSYFLTKVLNTQRAASIKIPLKRTTFSREVY